MSKVPKNIYVRSADLYNLVRDIARAIKTADSVNDFKTVSVLSDSTFPMIVTNLLGNFDDNELQWFDNAFKEAGYKTNGFRRQTGKHEIILVSNL